MSAKDNLNPHQLKLFMGGQEFQAASTHSVDMDMMGLSGMEDVWETKLSEAMLPKESREHGAGTYDSMKEHGYNPSLSKWDTPTLWLGNSRGVTQGEGHHRVASAAAIERTDPKRNIWIPVNYREW